MFRSVARCSVALAMLGVAGPTLAPANDVIPAAAAGTAETPPPPKVLVMNNGDLVEGLIVRTQTGFELSQPGGGRIFLATPFVWFAADSRRSAYDELRKRFPDQSANGHVALARWCVRYGLASAAEGELRTALTIDPDHREARASLKLLGEPSQPVPDPISTSAEAHSPDATLGGLPPELARAFVTTVQPIFVNGCGNASCHGMSSKRPFTLQNARAGHPAFKALTLRNFETIRGHIALDDPAQSDIFTKPQMPGHGGSRRPIFSGPSGSTQIRSLTHWAVAVARTMPRDEAQSTEQPSPFVLTNAQREGDPTAEMRTPVVPPPSRSLPSIHSAAPATDGAANGAKDGRRDVADVLRQAIAEERADAFDPLEFNRRFGPDAGRPTPPASEEPKP